MPPVLSIVIPTLDAAGVLGATLADAAPGIVRLAERGTAVEVVVADGGSRDGTADEARRHGARLVESEAGRGRQLAAGAAAAEGAWLLFLHADTHPAPGWDEEVSAFIAHLREPEQSRLLPLRPRRPSHRLRACWNGLWRCAAVSSRSPTATRGS